MDDVRWEAGHDIVYLLPDAYVGVHACTITVKVKETRCASVLNTDFFFPCASSGKGLMILAALNCRLTRRNDALGMDLIGRKEAYTKEGPFLATRLGLKGGHADRQRLDKRALALLCCIL